MDMSLNRILFACSIVLLSCMLLVGSAYADEDAATNGLAEADTSLQDGSSPAPDDPLEGEAPLVVGSPSDEKGNTSETPDVEPPKTLASATATLNESTFRYTGKPIKPAATVQVNGVTLKENRDYSKSYSRNTNVGTAYVTITGEGDYTGQKRIPFRIIRAKQKFSVTSQLDSYATTETIAQDGYDTIFSPLKTKNAKGKVTYKNVSTTLVGRRAEVDSRTGDISVPFFFSKSSFTVTLSATAAGNSKYEPMTKTADIKIKKGNVRTQLASVALNEWRRGAADGTYNKGGKRYWKLWFKKKVPWCSEFASWCGMRVGLQPNVSLPKKPVNAKVLYSFFSKHPRICTVHVNRKNSYRPKVGDIVFKGKKKGKKYAAVHTGIVVRVSKKSFQTVEGNAGNRVKVRTYSLKNYKQWRYFVTLKPRAQLASHGSGSLAKVYHY